MFQNYIRRERTKFMHEHLLGWPTYMLQRHLHMNTGISSEYFGETGLAMKWQVPIITNEKHQILMCFL